MTAVHEAGHAVVAHLQGRVIQELAICSRGRTAGYCASRSGDAGSDDARLLEDTVLLLGAGLIAEARLIGRATSVALDVASADLRSCMEAAERHGIAGTREERLRQVMRMAFAADDVLARPRNWSAVQGLAHELLERNVISGPRVHTIIERTMSAP